MKYTKGNVIRLIFATLYYLTIITLASVYLYGWTYIDKNSQNCDEFCVLVSNNSTNSSSSDNVDYLDCLHCSNLLNNAEILRDLGVYAVLVISIFTLIHVITLYYTYNPRRNYTFEYPMIWTQANRTQHKVKRRVLWLYTMSILMLALIFASLFLMLYIFDETNTRFMGPVTVIVLYTWLTVNGYFIMVSFIGDPIKVTIDDVIIRYRLANQKVPKVPELSYTSYHSTD